MVNKIIQGTTPTIKIAFPYNPQEITALSVAFLQGKTIKILKNKNDVEFSDDLKIIVDLSKEETQSLNVGILKIKLHYESYGKAWETSTMYAEVERGINGI